ncbi:hypothetical protein GN958_ATG03794 [Phytophthora infestans]|uniref:Uncharacterized protein n=1 Tax=Phytophthora infestans TaxID=4787 RepID=A0A8S9V6J8_PHYIN|nr:hypothetical protein GN958_ATG03794 [Phytophthora infestans]
MLTNPGRTCGIRDPLLVHGLTATVSPTQGSVQKSRGARLNMTITSETSLKQGHEETPEPVEQSMELDEEKPKRRKCTYAARREKAHELREEVRKLESQVIVLKLRSEQESGVDDRLKQTQAENATLSENIRAQHLQVAEMQSAMSQYLKSQQSHPLYTYIYLPKDWNKRQAKLVSIREEKLRNAHNFVMDPKRIVDSDKTTYSGELFESIDGDFCGIRFEIVQFPGVKSLQQVYDAALYYLTNMEISITERLGHITVRDDYETIDGSVYNARVLSTVHDTVTMETSSLLFPKMDPDGEYEIVVLDSIDEDELYPYSSAKRVRKDVSATAVFTVRRKPTVNGEEGELVVTMRGSAFLKIHRPQFAVREDIQQEMATNIMAWGDVMVKSIRSIVYGAC